MKKLEQEAIDKFIEAYGEKYGWKVYTWKGGTEIQRKHGEYNSSISLTNLKNVEFEDGELHLAYKSGYMVWLIEDSIMFDYEPDNPLFGMDGEVV